IANTNIELYTNINTRFNCVAKYVSKGEERTKSYSKIIIEIIPQITARNPIEQFATKFINKLISKRD
ncbi:hypothetical protein B0T13DRAFT_370117, partial [Neurospora crassa]